jgi:hypothetical protein
MTIVAKPVIDKQFWILQQDNRKIGNVEACQGGYQVRINNQVAQFKTIKMVEQRINVHFETQKKHSNSSPANQVHGYPTGSRAYNGIWNVPQKIPMFTKTAKSKSWYAAGWYQVRCGRQWQNVMNPKLIMLQRYPYHGPFYTKEQADEYSPTTVC